MADDGARRSRSRSPPRRAPRGNRGGFRWKDDNRKGDRDGGRNNRRDRFDQDRREFRNRSPGRDRDRGNFRDRDRNRDRDSEQDRDMRRDRERLRSPRRDDRKRHDRDGEDRPPRKDKKNEAPSAPAATGGEEMIIVNVNDRLGSKSAVPCLPSDTVGQFKIMVAARIGREPSQIMLRRQGERPFKDHITLEDYGISNGVQLDLEIDTGD